MDNPLFDILLFDSKNTSYPLLVNFHYFGYNYFNYTILVRLAISILLIPSIIFPSLISSLSIISPLLALRSSIVITRIIWTLKTLFLLNMFNKCFGLYYINQFISFLTYCPDNSFNGQSLASCPYLQQMLQIICRSLHSFIKWPSLWHFWQNTPCRYPSPCSLWFFLLSFFCSSLANFSSQSSLSNNRWDRLLLCMVGFFSSISFSKLTTLTISALSIPIMANFNFLFSPSPRRSLSDICYLAIVV